MSKLKEKLQRKSLIDVLSTLLVFYRREKITKEEFINLMVDQFKEKL